MIQAKKTTKTIRSKKAVVEKPVAKKERYFEAVGRRKTAVARVRIHPEGQGQFLIKNEFLVNGKQHNLYFPTIELQQIVLSPLEKTGTRENFMVTSKITGGGLHAQAEALRHGISRALIIFDQNLRKQLKKLGYLTRDARMRERKKFGLKRARKAPQWAKR